MVFDSPHIGKMFLIVSEISQGEIRRNTFTWSFSSDEEVCDTSHEMEKSSENKKKFKDIAWYRDFLYTNVLKSKPQ